MTLYLYGIWESTVTSVVSATIEKLNESDRKVDDVIVELYPLIFNAEYDGLYCAGRGAKWQKRFSISQKLLNNQKIQIAEGLMPTDGKNIKYKQLECIANSFGMKNKVIPKNEYGGYLEEMVKNRNHIAHGNVMPVDVGGAYSLSDIKNVATLYLKSEITL